MKAATVWMDDIIEALDQVHRYDGYLTALCPFHEDHHPSFFVYTDRYRCLSCGASGETNNLLVRMGKRARTSSVYHRQESTEINPFSIWLKHRTLSNVLKTAWRTLNDNPGMGYYITRDRGIPEPYRKKLGIGYIDDWYTIPITDRYGTIISATARKGRDNRSTSKYVLPSGTKSHLLYVPQWSRVRKAAFLVVTFGILDAITLAIMNIPSASIITGTRANPNALALFRIPIVVIPDRKEEKPGMELVQKLGWRGNLARIPWPDNCKDVNDIWTLDPDLCKTIMHDVKPGHHV